MDYGRALRISRAKLGIKNNELARRMRATPQFVSNLAHGRGWTIKWLEQTSVALEMSVVEFVSLAAEEGE